MLYGIDGIAGEDTGVEMDEKDGNEDEENLSNMEMDEVMRLGRELKIPPIPSVEEYKQHKLTHIPFRPWCPICVQGQSQNPPPQANKSPKGLPIVPHRLHVHESNGN